MLTGLVLSFWRSLPRGRPQDDPTWGTRHRTIVVVLLGHAIGLPIYGVLVQHLTVGYCLLRSSPLLIAVAVAAADNFGRRVRAATATLGLVGSSAILVDFSGGQTEAHFHFFVMLFVITLYQDWLTFLLAIAFVGIEHAVVGVLTPHSVYGHSLAQHAPVKYALIHASYVTGAALAAVANWRLTDRAQAAERELADQLAHDSSHDPLTGALNRSEFEHRIAAALSRTDRFNTVVCLLDLDRFKIVNDTCGHPAGDRLLVEVTEVLTRVLGPDDTLARLGGDEFGVLLERPTPAEAEAVAEAACAALVRHTYRAGQHTFSASASVGVLPLSTHVKYVEEAMQMVDAACYTAKEQGRSRVHVHQHGDAELARRNNDSVWASALLEGLRTGRLELVYQPIVPTGAIGASTGRELAGHGRFGEILVRLYDAEGSLVSPGLFFPAAERYDLLPAIDRWVVRRSMQMLSAHYPAGAATNGDLYSINLAGPSIGDEMFLEYVLAQLNEFQVPPSLICFEITETVAITNLAVARRFITDLRATGCSFALDDFGSGLSSFAYLKSLPVDFLKIDGRFVRTITTDSIDRTMVEAVNRIGHEMGLRTVAEFVEDDATLAVLREIGVDFGQGFGLGKPGPLGAWLAERRPGSVPPPPPTPAPSHVGTAVA